MSAVDELFGRIKARYNREDDKPSPVVLTRWTRATFINALGSCHLTRGAELGVREGLGALALCQAMPGLHLLCVDPWAVWPGHHDMRRHADNPQLFLDEARARLAGYDCEFIQARSADCAAQVPAGSLDFVFIDGDHTFDGTMLDLVLWAPKVRSGGIVAGHEFKFYRYNGVVAAVTAYAAAHVIREWYVTNEKDAVWFWQAK